VIVDRPAWHALAACRGDRRWLDDAGRRGLYLEPLRQACRGCPVAGECLREALELPPHIRHAGVLRCGVNGPKAWHLVEAIAAELDPCTSTDWADLATWLLDGDLAELDPQPIEACPKVAHPVAVVAPIAGRFPTLWNYDPAPAGQAFTKVEILAARR
jgi:hypothetical protein